MPNYIRVRQGRRWKCCAREHTGTHMKFVTPHRMDVPNATSYSTPRIFSPNFCCITRASNPLLLGQVMETDMHICRAVTVELLFFFRHARRVRRSACVLVRNHTCNAQISFLVSHISVLFLFSSVVVLFPMIDWKNRRDQTVTCQPMDNITEQVHTQSVLYLKPRWELFCAFDPLRHNLDEYNPT